ncbi:MAG TPA: hypothetical protein QF508_06325 [Candidatus Thalassarchaeaceae archaeon]|nr:hypothetical protein [Candidatus Thalassarchaeaceae archaeon]
MEEAAFRKFHRQIVIFAFIDMLIIALIIYQPARNYLDSSLFTAILVLTWFGVGIIARGYWNRDDVSLNRMVSLNEIMKYIFLFTGILHLIIGLSSNEMELLIQSILLIALYMVKRRNILQMKHPIHLKWYSEKQNNSSILNEGEVYASCPTCSSLLAVIPNMLSPSDRCPNCEGLLVPSFEEE